MIQLTKCQVNQFHRDGFLISERLLDTTIDLRPVKLEYEEVLDQLARDLFQAGEIDSTYDRLPFGKRLIRVYIDSGKVHSGYFDCSLPQLSLKSDSPIWVGPEVFRMLRNETLLDAVEDLIGPEIYSNPVQHIRIKPPEHLIPNRMKDSKNGLISGFDVGATPWHQDNGVVLPEADETDMLTVWFPLTEATEKNGCLQVIRGSHRQGLLHHCSSSYGMFIPDQLLSEDVVTVPMSPGDVLFMHRRTCHSSLPNRSKNIRMSFDLRYNPIGQSTGREVYPGFVARSRENPKSELHDSKTWAELWYQTRRRLVMKNISSYNRWLTDDPICA